MVPGGGGTTRYSPPIGRRRTTVSVPVPSVSITVAPPPLPEASKVLPAENLGFFFWKNRQNCKNLWKNPNCVSLDTIYMPEKKFCTQKHSLRVGEIVEKKFLRRMTPKNPLGLELKIRRKSGFLEGTWMVEGSVVQFLWDNGRKFEFHSGELFSCK